MSRLLTRWITTLITALVCLLVIGALMVGGAFSHASTSPPARPTRALNHAATNVPINSAPTCFSWDFLNNTGQDADGLHISLQGIPALTAVYTDSLNPFGAPDPTSGYDGGSAAYVLTFTNGTAFDSDNVRLGLCADRSSLRLGPQSPAFDWTVSGVIAPPNPLFAGLSVDWLDRTHLHIGVYNDQAISLTLMTLQVLDPGGQLPLNDLGDDTAQLLPLADDIVADPQTLMPGDTYTATSTLQAFHPYVIEAVLAAEDDPGNVIHVLAQTVSPAFNLYLPLVRK